MILLPSLLPALQVGAFLLTVVFACIRSCDTNNSTQSLTCATVTSWAPTLAEVPHKFGFVHLPICLQCKISGSSVFSDFFHEGRHDKVRKVTDPGFWEKIQMGSEGWKSPKDEVFRVLAKILSIQICFFASLRKCQWSFNFLQKQHVWEKSPFWVMVQKPQDQSECRIL